MSGREGGASFARSMLPGLLGGAVFVLLYWLARLPFLVAALAGFLFFTAVVFVLHAKGRRG